MKVEKVPIAPGAVKKSTPIGDIEEPQQSKGMGLIEQAGQVEKENSEITQLKKNLVSLEEPKEEKKAEKEMT